MRRTGNASASPAIGIVTTGTANSGFAPVWAGAGRLWVAAPASASAPVAMMVLRSTVSKGILLCAFLVWPGYLAPCSTPDKPTNGGACRNEKGPRYRGPKSLVHIADQCLISG